VKVQAYPPPRQGFELVAVSAPTSGAGVPSGVWAYAAAWASATEIEFQLLPASAGQSVVSKRFEFNDPAAVLSFSAFDAGSGNVALALLTERSYCALLYANGTFYGSQLHAQNKQYGPGSSVAVSFAGGFVFVGIGQAVLASISIAELTPQIGGSLSLIEESEQLAKGGVSSSLSVSLECCDDDGKPYASGIYVTYGDATVRIIDEDDGTTSSVTALLPPVQAVAVDGGMLVGSSNFAQLFAEITQDFVMSADGSASQNVIMGLEGEPKFWFLSAGSDRVTYGLGDSGATSNNDISPAGVVVGTVVKGSWFSNDYTESDAYPSGTFAVMADNEVQVWRLPPT
jgi:hypothetical protein